MTMMVSTVTSIKNEITLLEAWHIYLPEIEAKTCLKTDLSRFRNIIAFFKDTPLNLITPILIRDFKITLEKKRLSPQTIYHYLKLIKRIYNFSKNYGLYCGDIPYFKMPTFDNKRVRFLSQQEATQLLATLKTLSPLWHDITRFALYTGMRAKEIFNLQCSSINFENNTIQIFDSKGKNRSVSINPYIKNLILKYYTLSEQLLFIDNSKQIKRRSKHFLRAIKLININQGVTDRRQKVVFHTLRHTFASWLIQNGSSLESVSAVLGHSSLQMTLRYAHLAPTDGEKTIRCLPLIT